MKLAIKEKEKRNVSKECIINIMYLHVFIKTISLEEGPKRIPYTSK